MLVLSSRSLSSSNCAQAHVFTSPFFLCDRVSFSRGSSSIGSTSSLKSSRWTLSRATNATANAVAGNRTSAPGAAIEREPRLLVVGGVKQVPRLLPTSSSRDGSHLNMGDACVWCVCHLWWRNFQEISSQQ